MILHFDLVLMELRKMNLTYLHQSIFVAHYHRIEVQDAGKALALQGKKA
jgi:hypothetical protein